MHGPAQKAISGRLQHAGEPLLADHITTAKQWPQPDGGWCVVRRAHGDIDVYYAAAAGHMARGAGREAPAAVVRLTGSAPADIRQGRIWSSGFQVEAEAETPPQQEANEDDPCGNRHVHRGDIGRGHLKGPFRGKAQQRDRVRVVRALARGDTEDSGAVSRRGSLLRRLTLRGEYRIFVPRTWSLSLMRGTVREKVCLVPKERPSHASTTTLKGLSDRAARQIGKLTERQSLPTLRCSFAWFLANRQARALRYAQTLRPI
jgi:hypothetical protein